jgi:hypothetical protein
LRWVLAFSIGYPLFLGTGLYLKGAIPLWMAIGGIFLHGSLLYLTIGNLYQTTWGNRHREKF